MLDDDDFESEITARLARLYYYRGEIFSSRENYQQAREMFFSALSFESTPQPPTLQALAHTNYKLGKYSAARENIARLRELHPDFEINERLVNALWWQKEGYTWLSIGLLALAVLFVGVYFMFNDTSLVSFCVWLGGFFLRSWPEKNGFKYL
ncbi:MAG: hypothetical protein ACLFN5_06945 [bacterium]